MEIVSKSYLSLFPRFENIEGMVTVGRSRGIRYLFVLQSFSQLTAKYGRDIGDIIKTNCNIKIFIGSDDPETRKEFSELCGQKKVKNFSVNTNAENPASSNTGASNQPLITVGMLERLNGDEKGDAIVSVRGYEPIWTRFTPSYELKDIYFSAGKVNMEKKEARLFDKREYVFDILSGSEKGEEEKILEAIEKRDLLVTEEDTFDETSDLDREWLNIKEEIHEKVLKTCKYLKSEDSKALQEAKLENKLPLLYGIADNYSYEQSGLQKLQDLIRFMEKRLPRMMELQEASKK